MAAVDGLQARRASPAAADCRPGTTPCSPPSAAPTTSCSASPTPAGSRPSFDAILERVAWWAEVFEIPCVGFAGDARGDRAAGGRGRRFRRRRRLRSGTIRAVPAAAHRRGRPQRSLRRAARRCRMSGRIIVVRCRRRWRMAALSSARRCRPQPQAARRSHRAARAAAAAAPRPRADTRLWRVPARPLPHRVPRGDAPRRGEKRSQGDDAARRALRRRPRRSATTTRRRPNGTGSPPTAATARRCSRSPCSGWPAAPARATATRPRKLLAAAAKLGHVVAAYDLGAALPRRPDCSRRTSPAPPSCSAAPPRPATRRRNTRSPPSTRKAAACRRTSTKRRGCWRRGARRLHRRRGRIRHRAVQRHRRRQERGRPPATIFSRRARKGSPVAQNRLAHVLPPAAAWRTTVEADQVAPDRQGRRRRATVPRRLRAASRSRTTAPPPKQGRAVDRGMDAIEPTPLPTALTAAAAYGRPDERSSRT